MIDIKLLSFAGSAAAFKGWQRFAQSGFRTLKGMASLPRDVNRLINEWQELNRRCDRVVAEWAGESELLDGCRCLDDVLAAISANRDPVLRELLRLGAAGDPFAHRTILQWMLPKVVAAARKDARNGLKVYLAEVWLGIITYPLLRRPHSIAANIMLDARKRVWAAMPPTAEQQAVIASDSIDPGGFAVADMLREAVEVGLISEHTHSVLVVVYLEGMPSQQAAEYVGLSRVAVRRHCSHALRLLRLNAHLFEV
ncbi:MAG: hypothetical protein LBI99_01425 [Propionibacteriaceae bacterium]|nr:hypothetical protein [Propionibacteriaceae bacterium]